MACTLTNKEYNKLAIALQNQQVKQTIILVATLAHARLTKMWNIILQL